MSEQLVSTVASHGIENLVNTIGRQFGYLWNYKKNKANLEKNVKMLENKINDMGRSVIIAERNAEEIGDDVQRWLSEAKGVIARERKFLQEHVEKRCLVGLCPNLVDRYQFSRRACKKEINVGEVIAQGRIKKVSFRPVEQETIVLSTNGFFAFDSRKSIMEDIMKALQDETKRLVGVYGLGGMGKTTLVKQIASRAKEMKLFEEVVFALVTEKVDVKEIQGQIASMLDLKLDESTVAERAKRVHQRLKGKKALVILDDLWKYIDLKEVGVSFGADRMGCKILLISRFGHVLTSMGTEKDFDLGALNEEEAWRLFEEKTYNVIKIPGFLIIGKEVAKRCRGWPVLIVTIAASLSRRPQLPAWNDALNQLKKMNNKEMQGIVNSAIESISYNHLGKTHKRLFLLCGIIGGVSSIEELLQYSWGWNLFDGEATTIQEARDRLHNLIVDLKDSCLLLNVDSSTFICMHDVVRDVAISIGKKDLHMFSQREDDGELSLWHKDDDFKKCTAMVLRGRPNLSILECPSLELFVMTGFSQSIPEIFFEKTSKLKVLGMSRLRFTSLPQCLSYLTNLQTLRVENCDCLKDVSVVGELKNLEMLSFAGSGIEELPSGIHQMTKLRLLDMRNCYRLKAIPVGLIKGLSRLEELYAPRNFDRWEAEVCVRNNIDTNDRLHELEHLPNLCSLEISVRDYKRLPENLNFEKLERYEIIVGDIWGGYGWWWLDGLQVTRTICLQLSTTSINRFEHGVKRLFKRTECLCLGELKGVKSVTPALDEDGFPNLKHLQIKKDYDIEYVVNVEDKQDKAAFLCLESLHLIELMNLRKLCNGPLMEQSLCNLTILKVEGCNRLESLFSFSMAIRLPRLQEIEVSSCDVVEDIVAEKNINDDGVCEKIEFAQLRRLRLTCLRNLKNFFNDSEMQNTSQKCLRSDDVDFQEIRPDEEKELISYLPFFTKVSFPKLQELVLCGISNLTEIWSHAVSRSCCNLTKLEINYCDNLKYLLTPSTVTCLVGLQSLTVENCSSMKHVVVKEEGDTNTVTITFPHLSYLCLQNLDLTTFYSSENLNSVTQPLFNEKVSFPKLCRLELSEFSNLGDIFQVMPCRDLTYLTIRRCKSLKHVFPASVAQSLRKLENLSVEDCGALETVIGDDESVEESVTFLFPKLTKVDLHTLPKAECLYPKEHTIQCPELKELEVVYCGKLYAFDFLSFPEKQGDAIFEKVLSNLKIVSLRNNDVIKILGLYDDHLPRHLFRSLENLDILEFHDESGFFPSKFLSVVQNKLQSFRVFDCSFQEIFSFDDILLPQLKNLSLEKLPELKYICKHDEYSSCILNVLDRLTTLLVEDCPRLTNFVSSAVCFRSLTILTVKDCGGLTNLIRPSTTKSLGNLRKLNISGCETMEKIIGDDEEPSQDGDEFIFTNLHRLELDKLPRLTNFCSSPNLAFSFPNLRFVSVRECPNMTTLCRGITSTPKLILGRQFFARKNPNDVDLTRPEKVRGAPF